MRKYRNKKVEIDGHIFDSKKEGLRYKELKWLEQAGLITNLKIHPKYPLQRGAVAVKYPNGRLARYTADFEYFDVETNTLHTEDVKGYMTQESKLRIAVFEALYRRKVRIT